MSNREFNLSGFTRINVRFAMEVEIVKSDSYSVSVSGSDMLVDNIDVSLEGDRLIIGYKLNLISFFTAPFTRAHARITLPELRELNITGAVRGTVKGFDSPGDFALSVAGASRLDISDMSSGSMKWDISGASHIDGQVKIAGDVDIRVAGATRVELKGSAQDLNIEATGASHIDLKDLALRNARVRMSGASRSTVNLNGKLDVDLSGASNLEYTGQVAMGDVRVTGASTLKKK
jgi:hypothetical protein